MQLASRWHLLPSLSWLKCTSLWCWSSFIAVQWSAPSLHHLLCNKTIKAQVSIWDFDPNKEHKKTVNRSHNVIICKKLYACYLWPNVSGLSPAEIKHVDGLSKPVSYHQELYWILKYKHVIELDPTRTADLGTDTSVHILTMFFLIFTVKWLCQSKSCHQVSPGVLSLF